MQVRKPFDLVLVACSATKAATPMPAGELYTSQLFRASKRWAIANGDRWAIVSALHGIVWPGDILEPYDHRLPRGDRHAVRAFGFCLQADLSGYRRELGRSPRVAVLAGRDYVDALRNCGAVRGFVEPLAGLGIGQRLQWLARQTAAAAA